MGQEAGWRKEMIERLREGKERVGGDGEGGGLKVHLLVQLHSLHSFVLVQQHGSILEQQALHLWYAILLCQGNSLIPLA